jgi:hypothetical protein
MEPRFEQFIQEKKYLANVSPATCEWYKQSLHWLLGPSPDEAALKDFVMRMRAKGLTASSCNCHIRAVNSYLHWASGVSTNTARLFENFEMIHSLINEPEFMKAVPTVGAFGLVFLQDVYSGIALHKFGTRELTVDQMFWTAGATLEWCGKMLKERRPIPLYSDKCRTSRIAKDHPCPPEEEADPQGTQGSTRVCGILCFR